MYTPYNGVESACHQIIPYHTVCILLFYGEQIIWHYAKMLLHSLGLVKSATIWIIDASMLKAASICEIVGKGIKHMAK